MIALSALTTALVFLIRLRASLRGPIELRLSESMLHTPGTSLKQTMLSIPYEAITRVMIHAVSSQQLLVIESSMGSSRLTSIGFSSESEFSGFCKGLIEKTRKL